VYLTQYIRPLAEIFLLIQATLHLEKFFHGKAHRCTIILSANLFFDVIFLCYRIINDILLNERRIAKAEGIAIGIGVRIAVTIVQGISRSISAPETKESSL